MSGFEKISKMNLADLERPDTGGNQAEEEMADEDLSAQPEDQSEVDEMTAETATEETTDNINEENTAVEETGLQQADGGQTAEDQTGTDQTDADQADQQEPQKMAEPVGEHYYFDAEFTEKDMVTFLFSHYYRQPLVIFATIFAVLWPIVVFVTNSGNKLFPAICLVFFLVYMPLSTYFKGKNVVKRNPIYQKTFHYMIDEWGFHLEIEDQAVDVRWERVRKIVYMKSLYLVYTGKDNAFLLPTSAFGDRYDEITAFLKKYSQKR